MRLIDADKTIGLLKTRLYETALNNATVNCDASYLYTDCADNRIKTWIDEIPTIDPVKHGKWESNEYVYTTGQTICSKCKTEFYVDDLLNVGEGAQEYLPQYCPHCGARMEGSEK